MSKKWKQLEKNAADAFNTQRTPFSGSNSGLTSGDSLHDRLYVECKRHKSQAVITLMKSTKELADKEGKVPVLYLQEPDDRNDRYIMFHEKDLFNILREIDLSKADKRIEKGTTIYDILGEQQGHNQDIYTARKNLRQRLKELFREKTLNEERIGEIQAVSVLLDYIDTVISYIKEGLED